MLVQICITIAIIAPYIHIRGHGAKHCGLPVQKPLDGLFRFHCFKRHFFLYYWVMKTKNLIVTVKRVFVFERFITFSTHSTEYKANGDLLLQTEHIQKYFWMPCSLNFINTLTCL